MVLLCIFVLNLKTLWPLFMDGVQLCQGYKTTTRRQFTFYHSVPRSSWYSTDWPWKDKRLSWPWSQPSGFEPLTRGLGIQCLNFLAPGCADCLCLYVWYQNRMVKKNHVMSKSTVSLMSCFLKHTARSF